MVYPKPGLVSPDDGSTAGNLKPTFTWNNVPNATSYKFQVSTSQSFATTLVNVTVTGTSYTPGVNLKAHATLYWRVQALGPYGPGPWANFRSVILP